MTYDPHPFPFNNVSLPEGFIPLAENLSSLVHDQWAFIRISEGWRYGPIKDGKLKKTPNLVPYSELPECERAVDREIVLTVLKSLIGLGHEIKLNSPE